MIAASRFTSSSGCARNNYCWPDGLKTQWSSLALASLHLLSSHCMSHPASPAVQSASVSEVIRCNSISQPSLVVVTQEHYFMEKRRMSRIWTILLAVCAVASMNPVVEARSGYLSGSDLLESCKPRVIDAVYRLKVAECRGYVVGVADTFDCTRSVVGGRWNSRVVVSQEELVNIVIRWLNAHPRQLHYQADGLIAAALSEAFPCAQ